MGLTLDGVENLSAIMDRDNNEQHRPRSVNHGNKNSHDRNYRSSGERGLNGSRLVPVEKPLSLIISRNESLENGHYSSLKSGYLQADDLTRKALDVVHGHSSSSTPASSVGHSGPSTSSSMPNSSFTSPQRGGNRQEEVMKRKNIVGKIEKLREGKKMETFIAQMDFSTPNQISMNVRRYARSDKANLPEKIKNFILEGFDSPVATKVKNNAQSSSKNSKLESDGDATDYEDMEEKEGDKSSECASSSHGQWLMERAEFIVMDTKIGYSIETTEQRILQLTKKLEALESDDGARMGNGREEETYSRLIPWNGRRRKLVKMEEYLLNALPSTSKECAVLTQPSFALQSLQYLHRTAIMPSFHIRKNTRKSMWLNDRELEEEKIRNGVKKKEEREKREKRRLERAEKDEEEEEKSDEYEVTDDDDDEIMPMPNHSKRANGAPKEKRRKKDTERKSLRREINKNRRSSDCPPSASRLSSVTSRPSLDGDMDYLTPTFNHAHWLDNFKCVKPTNFTYNKIPVPDCRLVRIDEVEVANVEDANAFNTESLIKKMAIPHHQLEHEERIRFTMHPRGVRSRGPRGASRDEREASQDSPGSRSTPSNREQSEEADTATETGHSVPPPSSVPSRGRLAPTRTPLISHFDYNAIRPMTDYERLSIEPPYEKRKFSR